MLHIVSWKPVKREFIEPLTLYEVTDFINDRI